MPFMSGNPRRPRPQPSGLIAITRHGVCYADLGQRGAVAVVGLDHPCRLVAQAVALVAGLGLRGVGRVMVDGDPLLQDLERSSGVSASWLNQSRLAQALLPCGGFLAPQRFQLAVIDVPLDGIAYQPRSKSGGMASLPTL
jgi:hypothetical protein